MITLADAAPTGSGLAIVAVILLAFAALVVGAIVLAVVLLTRRSRRRKLTPVPGWHGAAATPPASPASD